MTDSQLEQLLRQSETRIEPPESFRCGVWNRIEADALDRRRPLLWLENTLSALANPLPGTAAIAFTIAFGLWMGALLPTGPDDSKRAYVESVSPFITQDSTAQISR